MLAACLLFYLSVIFNFSTICGFEDTFLYFAYGSNLSSKRLLLNNPSAVFYGPAELKNYRLDFNTYSKSWNGAVATIVEDTSSVVLGALWTMDTLQMEKLNEQEGVSKGLYYPKTVKVITNDGRQLEALTYVQTNNPREKGLLPMERRPSKTYLQVIVIGAYECGLPLGYITYLNTFPTNGQYASRELREQLGFPFNVDNY